MNLFSTYSMSLFGASTVESGATTVLVSCTFAGYTSAVRVSFVPGILPAIARRRPAHHAIRMPTDLTASPNRGSAGLVDILDRVLDKGLVVAGDIKVSLAEVELLTIRIRLMICSIDKAEEIGLDWWKYDRHLSPGREQLLQENLELREQLQLLERRVASLTRAPGRRGRAAGKALIPD